jgi:hypothetical protein
VTRHGTGTFAAVWFGRGGLTHWQLARERRGGEARGRIWGAACARALVENSPFVSVTDNPAAAAATTDPWLRMIVARAPNLSEFSVPASRLIAPSNALSISEGEYLFQGNDLSNYLVETRANPFGGR